MSGKSINATSLNKCEGFITDTAMLDRCVYPRLQKDGTGVF